MRALLRFLASLNAAVWLGSAVFLTVAVGPAFFSPEMLELMPRETAGRAAQLVLGRYFLLVLVCGVVGLSLGVAELAVGRRRRLYLRAALLALLLGMGLIGGWILQPRLKELHRIRYATSTPDEDREKARRRFGQLHGASQLVNLLMVTGLLLHFRWTLNPGEAQTTLQGASETNSGN